MSQDAQTVRPALFALALMLFCFLTSEVFAAGAMTGMSHDLGVPAATIGSLVTVYAVVAATSIVPMTVLARRMPVRIMLVSAVGVLALAHLLMAFTDSLGLVLAARIAIALFHGPIWALSPVIATRLMPDRPAAATATVFLGPSIANVAGAPLVAAVSEHSSWRVASMLIAVLALGSAVVLATTMPVGGPGVGDGHTTGSSVDDRSSRRVVLRLCVIVILLSAAHLSAFTFISVTSREAGVPTPHLATLLLAMGVSGALGNLAIGRHYDARPRASLLVAATVMAVGLTLTAGQQVPFIAGALLWPAAYSALTAALPAAVVRAAPRWAERASAWYVLAFQLGIAAGAELGAHPAAGGSPSTMRAVIAALLTVGALTLLAAHRMDREKPCT